MLQTVPDSGEYPRCLAVMYHYVHDRESAVPHDVGGLTTKQFRRQLDRLCSVMEPIDWPTLYAWMEGRGNVPDRSFLLTFDDGLADHANVVLPILRERNLRGLFFVPGAILESQRLLAAHAIHLLLAALGEHRLWDELLAYLAEHNTETDWAASLDTQAAKRMYHYETPARAQVKYLLTMTLPLDLRAAAVQSLLECHVASPARWSRAWYLGWEDLVRLETLGHTVGGHGYSHEPYSRLTSTNRRHDVRRVATVLRAGLGERIRPFSYPYGDFDDETARACPDVGFVHAFTTRRGLITRDSDLLRLPRVDTIDVDSVMEEEFACAQI